MPYVGACPVMAFHTVWNTHPAVKYHPSVSIDPENWFLHSRSWGRVPRDTSHLIGWDWVDASSGILRLYGVSCGAAMLDRGGLAFVATRERCLESFATSELNDRRCFLALPQD